MLLIQVFVIAKQYDENTLKSVFIEKFTRFIDWPTGSNVTALNKPFIIGIYGETDIKDELVQIYGKQNILDKEVKVKNLGLKNINDCDLLIIAENKLADMPKITEFLKDSKVLTIGETADFAEEGAMIAYVLKDNKIRFIINQKQAVDCGFKISHLLLNLAEVINPVNQK